MKNKLVIFGTTSFAEICYLYFLEDSTYDVVAFVVDHGYKTLDRLFGKPVFEYHNFLEKYDPSEFSIFVAATYHKLNTVRSDILTRCKKDGFTPASYTSPNAFIHETVKFGEHNFIFENNVVQPMVQIGDNNILWSGNHIGHHSIIGSNNFISSHCVISGHVDIGVNCFLGVNTTISNNLEIGNYSWIEPASVVKKNIPHGAVVKSVESEIAKVSSFRLFKVSNVID